MKNPITQYFAVEERPDGVYIKVSRQQRDSTSFDSIIKSLYQARVMNLDIERFKDVFVRSRGGFEKIGPLFEYFDPELENYFQLNITPSKALFKISSSFLAAGKKISEKELIYYLNSNKVNTGILEAGILELLDPENYNRFIVVAEGTEPQKGESAKIELKFEMSSDFRPQLRENGSVDYRNIQTFIPVSQGQVIAEKIPAQQGKNGKTVTGEPIPAEPGNDTGFPGGRNTEVSKDGKFLLSSKTGILFQDGGLFHIKELLQIEKDVDFSVGNIKYTGDVLIKGNVHPGFTIESEGNIHIKGELEASRVISRSGYVIVEKGIIGKGNAFVSGKTGIKIGFAQDANLTTDGPLEVEKSLLHCVCICKNLEINGIHSSVVGCNIKAEVQMIIKNVGNEKESSSQLYLFDKQRAAIEEKIKGLEELEEKLNIEMEPIKKQLTTKAALVKKAGELISDRIRDEVKKWIDAHNNLAQKIKYVNQKKEELRSELEKPKIYTGFIKIPGSVFPVTEIDLYGMKLTVQETLVNKNFHLNEKGSIEG